MILAALVEVAHHREVHDERECMPRSVRNGQAQPQRLTVGSETVTIATPRINEQRVLHSVRQKFTGQILSPYLHRCRATGNGHFT